MKRYLLTALISIVAMSVSCQTKEDHLKLNFDFEQVNNNRPIGWMGGVDGTQEASDDTGYIVRLDSAVVQHGKYSAVIEYQGGTPDFQSLSCKLPGNYDGRFITLTGYIKTENVTGGYAGLWMRIDPEIAFDNMGRRGITGTTDWTKYTITLPLNPSETQQIIIGGLLVGKGKVWLDNFSVSIDGKDIAQAKIFERQLFPAEKDREFDNGSAIVFPSLNKQTVNNLELLGRLWGFLKYHHPEVGKGNYNWDYELFRMLPAYLKVKNNQERDKVLLGWIDSYGVVPVNTTCKETPSDAYIKPGFSWVEKSNMNSELKKKIHEIYSNRHQGGHYYVRMAPYVNKPEFLHENPYPGMPYPDAGFRLLALYKYWNTIQYFFPNKYITDKNWDDVLKEYIPVFIQAGNELEYELAAVKIIGDVNDTHANLWGGRDKLDSLRGDHYAPFRVQFIEQKLVVTDYYNPELKGTAGVEIGDIITHIDGKTVESIVKNRRGYYPASNEAARLRDISEDMLRSPRNTIAIRYISSGQTKQKELQLYKSEHLKMYHWYKVDDKEKCYKLLDGNIGYITLANVANKDIPVIKKLFRNTKGIIIDIRNYPSAFMPFVLAPYFVSKSTPFVKFTIANTNNPGEFTFISAPEILYLGETYGGKLVVLVNEISQSQAEYTAMAFRAGDNTTIVGSTTAGADGDVTPIFLPGGLRTMISGIGVYYPDGTQTQRIGIVPDVKIEPTIEGIRQGRDEVLEKAIEVIEKQ